MTNSPASGGSFFSWLGFGSTPVNKPKNSYIPAPAETVNKPKNSTPAPAVPVATNATAGIPTASPVTSANLTPVSSPVQNVKGGRRHNKKHNRKTKSRKNVKNSKSRKNRRN